VTRYAKQAQKLAAEHALTPGCPNRSKITKRFSAWLSC
jgi:hypothetical protein